MGRTSFRTGDMLLCRDLVERDGVTLSPGTIVVVRDIDGDGLVSITYENTDVGTQRALCQVPESAFEMYLPGLGF